MTPLSSVAISAYTDLVRLLKDDAMSGVEGQPTLKQRGKKAYWYTARRVGCEMRFFYVGEDTEETCAARATATPRSFTNLTASSLNSRLNFLLCIPTLQFH